MSARRTLQPLHYLMSYEENRTTDLEAVATMRNFLLCFAILVVATGEVSAQMTEVVLHRYAGGINDGANPHASVTRDSAGNVYGTTESGGGANAGVVYKLGHTA